MGQTTNLNWLAGFQPSTVYVYQVFAIHGKFLPRFVALCQQPAVVLSSCEVATSEDQVGDEEAEVIPQPDLVRMMMMMMSTVYCMLSFLNIFAWFSGNSLLVVSNNEIQ